MNKYLIIGVHPTPNGSLHLGHISGPFLTLDIFSRCKKILGDDVYYITGSDSFESHVLLSSLNEGLSPLDVCTKNTNQIISDLHGFNIGIDKFISLHDYDHKKNYFDICQNIIKTSVNWNNTYIDKEIIPFKEKIPLVGCWLSGTCPVCNSDSGSYYCEECGYHYRPEFLIDKRSNLCGTFNSKEVNSLFIRSKRNEILKNINNTYFSESYVAEFLNLGESFETRLTTPGNYGPPALFEECNSESVAFTYTVGLSSFYLMCAQEYLKNKKNNSHPFDDDSVRVVTAYGFDNISAYLTGMLPILNGLGYKKPIDIQFINRFMLLNGRKFSTSRNHAIWASNIIREKKINTDILRLFLSKNSPLSGVIDFNIEEITNEMNLFIEEWNNILFRLKEKNVRRVKISPNNSILENFKKISQDSSFSPESIAKLIISSVLNIKNISDLDLLSEFITISFIMWPIMPMTSEKVRIELGLINFEGIDELNKIKEIKKDFSNVFSLRINNIEKDILSSVIGEK